MNSIETLIKLVLIDAEGAIRTHAKNALLEWEAMLEAEICSGCGRGKFDVILYVIRGKAACCPDCSVLTVEERNRIREAMRGE